MPDGNTMLTRLLKGVWRDTATVTLGLVLMFAIAAADGTTAHAVIVGLPFKVDPQAVDLVIGGIFGRAVIGMMPAAVVISLAIRLSGALLMGLARVEERWLPDGYEGDTPLQQWTGILVMPFPAVPALLLLAGSLVGGFKMLHSGWPYANAAFCLALICVIAGYGGRAIIKAARATRVAFFINRDVNE